MVRAHRTGDRRRKAGTPPRVGLLPAAVVILLLAAAAGAPVGAAPEKGKDFVVVPSSGPLAGKQVYRESHALLVGINEYPRAPRELWLEYAANDVTALKDVLTGRYGFPEENVTVLLNGQATRERIYRELARLADKRKVQAEDRILIYFSGHGQTVKLESGGDMGFLIPSDADVDLSDPTNVGPYLASCVPMKSVWDYLESSPAKHVLLLADACYSGLLARSRALTSISPEALAALAGRRAIQVVTAGRRGEVSYELSRFGHGAFTQKLLEELKAKATTPGAVFTATELYAWVKRGVAELSKGKQTPQMGDYDTEGDFLFITAGRKEPDSGEVRVNPKDGSEMVYVPSGEFIMGEESGANWLAVSRPAHKVSLAGFWIDKREVSTAQYCRFLNETRQTKDEAGHSYIAWKAGWSPEALPIERKGERWQPKRGRQNYPMSSLSWYGAAAYAKWAGKRLPTEAEWEKAARGTDGRIYPWGSNWEPSNCRGLVPVGTRPAGASPYGCLNMAGNVWEWTSTLFKAYPYDARDGREDTDRDAEGVVRGMGWNNIREDLFHSTFRAVVLRSATYPDLGLRCALSAEAMPGGVQVAGAGAVGIPTVGTARPGQMRLDPKDGAAMLLVPAGEFRMGSEGGGYPEHPNVFDNEQPGHRVTLPDFWIDRCEVTVAQFARFMNEAGTVQDGAGHAYLKPSAQLAIHVVKGRWVSKPGRERDPMVWVTWHGAMAYAQWAGKRLPTEAEWEKAARGTESRQYPWGSQPDAGKWAAWGSSDPQRPFPIGSFPTDTSPYGCMDMAGNAWEWTSSLEKPYPYRPDDGREDPNAPGKRVARGGGISVWRFGRTSFRGGLDADGGTAANVMGFRCARSADRDVPDAVAGRQAGR